MTTKGVNMKKFVFIMILVLTKTASSHACDLEFDGEKFTPITMRSGQIVAVNVDDGQSMLAVCGSPNAVIEGFKRIAHLKTNSCFIAIDHDPVWRMSHKTI